MKKIFLSFGFALFLFLFLTTFLFKKEVTAQVGGTCSCISTCNEWGVCSCGIDSSGCDVGYTCPLTFDDCVIGEVCQINKKAECKYQGAGECECSKNLFGCSITKGCTSEGYTAVCSQDCGSCTCQSCGHLGEPCCIYLDDGCYEDNLYCNGTTCVASSQPTQPKPLKVKVFCDTSGNPCDSPGQGECTERLYTAIGCIPITDKNAFAGFLLRWGIGLAGGIAIILIIYAAFMIITSAGNPQRLQAGKELLTAAIMGVILLLFGAYILNLIGVTILKIPGL